MVKSLNKSRKKTSTTSKTKTESALSICPTDGNGWCSYPFSPAQLEKRLKAKQLQNSEDKKGKRKK